MKASKHTLKIRMFKMAYMQTENLSKWRVLMPNTQQQEFLLIKLKYKADVTTWKLSRYPVRLFPL
jgi:hypothetical protein